MPNNTTLNVYRNLPGVYPEKMKVYIYPGTNQRTWKANNDLSDNIFTQVVSRNSRPQTNLSVDSTYNRSMRSKGMGPLNPIKHWRKQLESVNNNSSKITVSQAMDYPGGTINLEKNSTIDCSTCAPLLTKYLTQYPNKCKPGPCPPIRNELSNFQPVTFNNPQRITRPRSSNTILKKNYYTTGAAYLRSRVKLFEQNQMLSPFQPPSVYVKDVTRPKAGNNYVYPTNSNSSGSQLYHSTQCVTDPSACCSLPQKCFVNVIYKPSNPFFSTQGAVTSSNRILDVKYKAITKNNWNFSQLSPNGEKVNLTVNGQVLPGSTPINYRGDDDAPYFIKSKYQQINTCAPSGYKISTHSQSRISGRMPSGGSGD